VIDGTDCPIDRPKGSHIERLAYYSGRKKDNARSKYNLKYTVGVQIGNGYICFVDGNDPGSKSDIRVLRESELVAEIIDNDPFEIIVGDKGYQGLPIFLTPFKDPQYGTMTPDESAFNEVLASVRQIVECSLHRIKIFGVLGEKGRFRHGSQIDDSLLKHKKYLIYAAK